METLPPDLNRVENRAETEFFAYEYPPQTSNSRRGFELENSKSQASQIVFNILSQKVGIERSDDDCDSLKNQLKSSLKLS
jgi:hypothetical protein